ncbi:Smad anchor for receptor activation Smad-binding domain [Trinorchestia longiramus]|nr:Smad anchor for receptor activation Smad-binding domain [Trinorchestia longiramus]
MEKFAVDLDKVLDDFELDEDEQVESSQFGRLQLDYSSSASNDSSIAGLPLASTNSNSRTRSLTPAAPGNVVTSSGGWSQPLIPKTEYQFPSKKQISDSYTKAEGSSGHAAYPKNDHSGSHGLMLNLDTGDDLPDESMIPAVRSPPDGQYDDQSSAAAHHSQYGGSGGGSGVVTSNYPPTSTLLGTSYQSHSSSQPKHTSSSYSRMNNSSNYATSSNDFLTSDSDSLVPVGNSCTSHASGDGSGVRRVAVGASPTGNAPVDFGSCEPSLSNNANGSLAAFSPDIDNFSEREVPGAVLNTEEPCQISDQSNGVSRPLDVVASADRVVGDGNASVLNAASNSVSSQRPLDVVTGAPSLARPSTRQEAGSRHPDVIDVPQQMEEDSPQNDDVLPLNNADEAIDNVDEELNPIPDLNDPRVHEARLLPDLMTNNGDLPHRRTSDDLPEPAIVAENAVPSHSSGPALVQESQSRYGIPEVANVHQTVEASACALTQPTNADSCSTVDLVHASSSPSYLWNYDNGSSSIKHPDEPNSNEIVECEQSVSSNPSPHVPIAFNPDVDINESDLQAELAELEEEQALLQGAYAVNSTTADLALESHPSVDVEATNSIVEPRQRLGLDVIGDVIDTKEVKNNDHNDQESIDTEEVQIQNASLPSVLSNSNLSLDVRCSQSGSSVNAIPSIDSEVAHEHSTIEPAISTPSVKNIDLPSTSKVCSDEPSVCCGEGGMLENSTQNCPAGESNGHSEETGQDARVPQEGVCSPVTDEQSLSVDTTTAESETTSPVRRTPGALVTAVYDDLQPGRRNTQEPVSEGANMVGSVAPFWVPDEDASGCQECGRQFTLVRRRHHCRACGRVLCANCCKDKAQLPYMDYREARVCATCKTLMAIAEDHDMRGPTSGNQGSSSSGSSSPRSPDPNNPMEYCSRIPPLQQAGAVPATPTVMVPVGVLKREGDSGGSSSGGTGRNRAPGSSKQVIFSDGIRPGGDLTEVDRSTGAASPHHPPPPHRTRAGRVARIMSGTAGSGRTKSDVCLLPPDGGLPPVLLQRGKGQKPEYMSSEGSGQQQQLAEQMAGDGPPVLFAVLKNLAVAVKLVKLDCCVGVRVWSVASRGLCGVGQEELVLLLEALPGETHPPPDVFAYFYSVYQQANKGNLVSELGHTILTEPDGFLGSRDHGGFLYVRPTFQCLHNLPLPQPPFLFALLIHKWEAPWAKVFPLRLLLRLGAEFRYYPCPLVSTRNRKPVFSEIGHTIMNLLVDFRNYTYTIPGIQGLVVHMEDKKTTLLIPRNRYAQISKALSNSNDHVLALAANFSPEADSHLVTIENDDGQYSTQAINIHNRPRKVTGASFVVFNGALKSNSGLTAKSSIVEDGLMVQITSDVMTALRESLRAMKDFSISCGVTGEQPQEEVMLRWTQDDNNCNVGVKSPIDGTAMDGVPSVKVHSGTDYVSSDFLIRWTEVFIIQGESSSSVAGDVNLSRIWEGLARGFCVALTPHLPELHAQMNTHLALRATIHHHDVGYEAGSGGCRLSAACLNSLDSELVPVIHRAAASVTHDAIVLELFFHVLQQ